MCSFKRLLLVACVCSLPVSAAVAHVKDGAGYCTGGASGGMGTGAGTITATCASPAKTASFTYTAGGTGNAVLFSLFCNDNSDTPSAVSLTATGWTLTQVGSINGSTGIPGWIALFKAYAPNTTQATFTETWTAASNCNSAMNVMIGEFSGMDATQFVDNNSGSANFASATSGGCALTITPATNNDGLWFACDDSVSGTGTYTKGCDDTQGDWCEWKVISGGAGVGQASAWTSSTGYLVVGVAIKPAGGAAVIHQMTLMGVGK